jgi:RHS repeat-associated protein
MTYNAMDKPLTITGRGPGNTTVTGFVYGSDGMRAKQTRSVSGVNTSTYYIDKYYEVDSDGSWRAYLDDIAVLSYTPSRQHLLHFTLRDRLGSATTMADQNGVVISRRYFDPFGKTTTQSPSASLLENIRRMTYDLDIAKMQDLDITNKNRRGFTDHEHLNEQQLIHMNGRVYDYNLGRFMSVDPLIQSPTSTQSINPYSYIMNNPLAGTDPTGYAAESTCSTGTNVKGNNGIGCSVVGLSSGPQKKKNNATITSNGANNYTLSIQLDKKTTLEIDFKVNDIGSQGSIASGGGVGGYTDYELVKMGFSPGTRFFNDVGDPFTPGGMTADEHRSAMDDASGIAAIGAMLFIPGPEDVLIGIYIAGRGAELTAKAVGIFRGADVVKQRVFWSGPGAREAAESFAKVNSAQTLEMTLAGKVLDNITTPSNFKYVKPLWNAASKNFAKGAKGSVDVFQSSKGVRLESVWAKKEFPILKRQGTNINYHIEE